jgi:Holliday junction DNA helicase RuvB
VKHHQVEIVVVAVVPVNHPKHNKILMTMLDKFNGGPVGLTTIATAVGEDAGTIEEVYEPFLIQEGFLMRTPRGRQLTELTYKHLGKDRRPDTGRLF